MSRPLVATKPYLTEREELFVRSMVEDPSSPVKAAEKAGYAPGYGCQLVSTSMMQRLDILDAINAGRRLVHARIAEETGVTVSQLVKLLFQMASVDIADLYDEDGNVLPIHQIPAHARVAIESLDTEEVFEGRGVDRKHVADVRKVRLTKRNESIDKLMRHLGGYELDNRQQLEPLTQLLREMAGRGTNTLAISQD
jgi:phage terminase small subunit